jgi:hypothetical protein
MSKFKIIAIASAIGVTVKGGRDAGSKVALWGLTEEGEIIPFVMSEKGPKPVVDDPNLRLDY